MKMLAHAPECIPASSSVGWHEVPEVASLMGSSCSTTTNGTRVIIALGRCNVSKLWVRELGRSFPVKDGTDRTNWHASRVLGFCGCCKCENRTGVRSTFWWSCWAEACFGGVGGIDLRGVAGFSTFNKGDWGFLWARRNGENEHSSERGVGVVDVVVDKGT